MPRRPLTAPLGQHTAQGLAYKYRAGPVVKDLRANYPLGYKLGIATSFTKVTRRSRMATNTTLHPNRRNSEICLSSSPLPTATINVPTKIPTVPRSHCAIRLSCADVSAAMSAYGYQL